jgi:3-deoxy-D-manno-octulosonate 8-phosphate phosphatase (KDO 8-P phosphatase)
MNHWNSELIAKIKPIKMLLLDVDGILTDCRIFLDHHNEWRRQFSIRDGYGIKMLLDSGYKVGIITASKSQDIAERAQALGLSYFFEGSLDKVPAYKTSLKESGLQDYEVAYMGDDLFDKPLLEKVGFAATVQDAMEEVIEVVDYIAKRPAGNGAVREVSDLIRKYGAFSGTP